jgi:hypothetical protein
MNDKSNGEIPPRISRVKHAEIIMRVYELIASETVGSQTSAAGRLDDHSGVSFM